MSDLLRHIPSVRAMVPADGDAVIRIYAEGIATGHATFTADAPDFSDWSAGHLERPRLVAAIDGTIVGWAALSAVSKRCVYAGVAEISVYVSEAARGRGVGDALMKALIERSEIEDIWTLQAGIFPENTGSLGLHQKHGFKVLGVRERLGRMTFGPMKDQWRDVVYLERRSAVAGID